MPHSALQPQASVFTADPSGAPRSTEHPLIWNSLYPSQPGSCCHSLELHFVVLACSAHNSKLPTLTLPKTHSRISKHQALELAHPSSLLQGVWILVPRRFFQTLEKCTSAMSSFEFLDLRRLKISTSLKVIVSQVTQQALIFLICGMAAATRQPPCSNGSFGRWMLMDVALTGCRFWSDFNVWRRTLWTDLKTIAQDGTCGSALNNHQDCRQQKQCHFVAKHSLDFFHDSGRFWTGWKPMCFRRDSAQHGRSTLKADVQGEVTPQYVCTSSS